MFNIMMCHHNALHNTCYFNDLQHSKTIFYSLFFKVEELLSQSSSLHTCMLFPGFVVVQNNFRQTEFVGFIYIYLYIFVVLINNSYSLRIKHLFIFLSCSVLGWISVEEHLVLVWDGPKKALDITLCFYETLAV